MTKQFSVKTDEQILALFDDLHSEMENATKGETFSEITLGYRKSKETIVKLSELTNQLTEENHRLVEENQMLQNGCAELVNKDVEIKRLTDQLTETNQKLTEEYQRKTEAAAIVPPEWDALAKAVAERNEKTVFGMLWHLFACWMESKIDPGLQRLKNSEKNEIINSIQN
jgi:uncharacterized phage infection (PIP) family protein YhgE